VATDDIIYPTSSKAPVEGFDKYVVHAALGGDVLLGGLLAAAAVLGRTHLGPAWPWLTLDVPIQAVSMILFLRYAALCWGGAPDPRSPRYRNWLAIVALLAGVAAIVVGFTLLYWTVGHLIGLPAFYAAVGTLTAVHPPDWVTTTGNMLQVVQELLDLVFLSGVVTIVLGIVVSRLSARP
jgi:hypothetical protein